MLAEFLDIDKNLIVNLHVQSVDQPIGPLQANVERSQAIQVMRAGMEAGINFFEIGRAHV